MATRWGLIVEENESPRASVTVLEHFTGTREEAMARLEVHARSYTWRRVMRPRRTRLYRTAEGFLLVNDGGLKDLPCSFSIAELLRDSDEERAAEEAARQAERQQRAAEREAKRAEGKSG